MEQVNGAEGVDGAQSDASKMWGPAARQSPRKLCGIFKILSITAFSLHF